MVESPLARRDRRTLVARTREDLSRRIRSGEFTPGQRLPSEPALSRAYDVSRVTMREAIKGLQQEHLLYTVHGRGTFIAHTPITRPVTRLQSVTEMAADLGYVLSTRVLSVRSENAATAAARALALDQGTAVLCLERLRLVDEQPAIYSLDYFLAALVQDDPGDGWQGSLFAFIEGQTGLRLTHSVATLRAALLERAIARRIGAKPNLPWLLMEQTNYTAQNRPIVYSLDYHRSDLFSFDVLRRRE